MKKQGLYACIFPNVAQLMLKRKMGVEDLAKKAGMNINTLSRKLRGSQDLWLEEAMSIRRALGTKMTLDELFETAEE